MTKALRTNGYDYLALLREEGSMGRWKGEQRGTLERRDSGWFGRWREHVESGGRIVYRTVTRKLTGPEATRGEAQIELAARRQPSLLSPGRLLTREGWL